MKETDESKRLKNVTLKKTEPMKYITLALLALTLILQNAFAQDQATAVRSMKPFHAINISSEIDAELVLSKEEKVEIALQGAETGQMITEVEDGVLKVRMRTGSYKDATLKVKIHFADINAIEATGRASVWSYEDIYTEKMDMKLYNGGAVRLGMYCDTLTVNISQGSVLTLRGKGGTADIKVNTNGTFNGYEFPCTDVNVTASSTGKAKVSATGSLVANASTGGFIGYVGDPKAVDRKVSLKGEILQTELED